MNEISWKEDRILVRPSSNLALKEAVHIEAGAYPKIGSDQLPILKVWASLHYNSVSVVDSKFVGRAMPLKQLEKLGWTFRHQKDALLVDYKVKNVTEITTLTATDLRTGFAILIACSVFRQKCIINNFDQLFRGYSRIIDQLNKVGIQVDDIEQIEHGSVAIILKDPEDKLVLQCRDSDAPKNPGRVSFLVAQ